VSEKEKRDQLLDFLPFPLFTLKHENTLARSAVFSENCATFTGIFLYSKLPIGP